MIARMTFLLLLLCGGLPCAARALEPSEVLLVVNTATFDGAELAAYYMKQRGIPEENIVRMMLPFDETVSRRLYDDKIAPAVLKTLKALERCLLLIHGMPLRVAAPELDLKEKDQVTKLQQQRADTQRQIDGLPADAKDERQRLERAVSGIDAGMARIQKADWSASVDSELALVAAGDYPLAGWLPNPFFIGNQKKELAIDKSKVLMVSRLDGPDAKIVKRTIDDSMAAERSGLSGVAYFDARYPEPTGEAKGGYEFYDASIHKASKMVTRSGRMPVKLESTDKLFQPGDGPDAALYCGWYSLANYIPAFKWRPGAVGYHIASAEATTLRQKESNVWCKRMLEEGAAAVIGPVDEPYVQAFPIPEVFFGLLMEGYLTLAECYAVATPWVSWRMVLVGDPLYRPFRNQ